MIPEEIAKQIEEGDLTEDDMNENGWGRICGNLLHEEARTIKGYNPGSVIIADELNPGKYLVMKFGHKEVEEKDGEHELRPEEETQEESQGDDENGQRNAGKVSGSVPDQQHNSPGSATWFDS